MDDVRERGLDRDQEQDWAAPGDTLSGARKGNGRFVGKGHNVKAVAFSGAVF
jgi:hypothetical protein